MRLIVAALAACLTITAACAEPGYTPAAAAVPVAKKPPFAVRHPKLHKVGRKTRKMCQVCQPFLSACGSAAQIATAFRR